MPFSRGVRTHVAPFDAHAVGHDEHEPVPLDRGDHRETHAGVARRRLDDRAAWLQDARGFGSFHHRQRDPVLDRAARIRALALHVDRMGPPEQPVDADVRRVADRVQDVVSKHAALRRAAPDYRRRRCDNGT